MALYLCGVYDKKITVTVDYCVDKFMHSAVPYFASRFHNSPAFGEAGSESALPLHRISILSWKVE